MTNFSFSNFLCVCVRVTRHILQHFVLDSGSTSFTVDQPDKEINSAAFTRFILLVNKVFLFTDCAELYMNQVFLAKLSGSLEASFGPSGQMFLIQKWQQFMSAERRALRIVFNAMRNQVKWGFWHTSPPPGEITRPGWLNLAEFGKSLFSRWVGVSLTQGNQFWDVMSLWIATKESNISSHCFAELPKGDAKHWTLTDCPQTTTVYIMFIYLNISSYSFIHFQNNSWDPAFEFFCTGKHPIFHWCNIICVASSNACVFDPFLQNISWHTSFLQP